MFTVLEAHYQTLVLPPPYAYAYTLRAAPTATGLHVQINWQYTDREELSAEEIEEEGFAVDSDFSWQGTLPTVWTKALASLLANTQLLSASSDGDSSTDFALQLITEDSSGRKEQGIPQNYDEWDYHLQELIQGTYEVSGQEQPWYLRYVDVAIDKRMPLTEVALEAQFAHRQLIAAVTKKGSLQKITLLWPELRPLIASVYVPDYHEDKIQSQKPRRQGAYLSFGDGWYELGKSVTNPGKEDTVKRIKDLMNEIIAKI